MSEQIIFHLNNRKPLVLQVQSVLEQPNSIPDGWQKIIWKEALSTTNAHQFSWLLRKLKRQLAADYTITIDLSTPNKLPFPADTLGAVVAARLKTLPSGDHEPDACGMQIDGLHKGGIAHAAGLQIGDVLLEFNHETVNYKQHPWKSFKGTTEGKIKLRYERDGTPNEVWAKCNKPLSKKEYFEKIASSFGLDHLGDGQFGLLRVTDPEKPLVSILMHAYKAKWFKEALTSAMNQTYANIEILIGDDCPTDDIKNIYENVAQNDHRVVYHKNNPPLGGWGAGNRYACFKRAKGPFIKYLCDDDVLMPDCIELLLDSLLENPRASLATSHIEAIDEKGHPKIPQTETVRRLLCQNAMIDGLVASNVLIGLFHNAIGTPSAPLFRKRDGENQAFYLDALGGIESEYGLDDVNLWSALLMKGDLAYVSKPLSQFRFSDEQGTSVPKLLVDAAYKWKRLLNAMHAFGCIGKARDFVLTALPLKTQKTYPPNDLKESIVALHKTNPKGAFQALRTFIPKHPYWPQASVLMFQLFPDVKQKWEALPQHQMLMTYRKIIDNMSTTAVKSALPVNELFPRYSPHRHIAFVATLSMPMAFLFVLEFDGSPIHLNWTINGGQIHRSTSDENRIAIQTIATEEDVGLTIEYWATAGNDIPLKPVRCTLNRVFF